MKPLKLGFIPEPLTVPLSELLPSHKIPNGVLATRKFAQIEASIRAVGLIEPLTVARPAKFSGQYVLLDGHVRHLVLQRLGFTDAPCFISVDDETYTFNKRVNRLSTIQEHMMIRRAVERGVTPGRIAQALCVDVSQISKKMRLLDGICAEATELLKDYTFSANLAAVLRKFKPTRQVECIEMMIAANRVTVAYAEALFAATPAEMLVGGAKPRNVGRLTPEQMARMEREMGNLQGRFKTVERSYGRDVLGLVLARGYLAKLVENRAVARYLTLHQPEILQEFRSIVQTTSLEQ